MSRQIKHGTRHGRWGSSRRAARSTGTHLDRKLHMQINERPCHRCQQVYLPPEAARPAIVQHREVTPIRIFSRRQRQLRQRYASLLRSRRQFRLAAPAPTLPRAVLQILHCHVHGKDAVCGHDARHVPRQASRGVVCGRSRRRALVGTVAAPTSAAETKRGCRRRGGRFGPSDEG